MTSVERDGPLNGLLDAKAVAVRSEWQLKVTRDAVVDAYLGDVPGIHQFLRVPSNCSWFACRVLVPPDEATEVDLRSHVYVAPLYWPHKTIKLLRRDVHPYPTVTRGLYTGPAERLPFIAQMQVGAAAERVSLVYWPRAADGSSAGYPAVPWLEVHRVRFDFEWECHDCGKAVSGASNVACYSNLATGFDSCATCFLGAGRGGRDLEPLEWTPPYHAIASQAARPASYHGIVECAIDNDLATKNPTLSLHVERADAIFCSIGQGIVLSPVNLPRCGTSRPLSARERGRERERELRSDADKRG